MAFFTISTPQYKILSKLRMPLKLEVKKKMVIRSVRVKSVDIHPTLPWVLVGLYSGYANIYDFNTQGTVKSFEVSSDPVRPAKFIVRKQWIAVGSDDFEIKIFNYNTMEKVKTLAAHKDFIRAFAVHPTLPYLISSSDDFTIKMWDWEKNWDCIKYEGHSHFVMGLCINPKDLNSFASASLDKTIRIWSVSTPGKPLYSLLGHEAGVNSVDYYSSGDKPYLASGSDDFTVKVWDYQTKNCLATLEGHMDNVSSVKFHPDLPIIISTCEDNSVKIWNSLTFKLETSLDYNLDRAWHCDILKEASMVALAYDEGTVVLKIGSDFPIADFSNAKVISAKNNTIYSYNLKLLPAGSLANGEKLPTTFKELGNVDLYVQGLKFNSNGQNFAVFGENDYNHSYYYKRNAIYTSRGFKNIGYGPGSELVWNKNDLYAVRNGSNIKISKGSSEIGALRLGAYIDSIFGGEYLGIKAEDSISFFDWESQVIIRRIEANPKAVYWNEDGSKVLLALEDGAFLLNCHKSKVASYLAKPSMHDEEGFEAAFELVTEINENIESAIWIDNCLVMVNSEMKLSYFLGKKPSVISRLPKKMLLLGYVPSQNRLYLIDKSMGMISYELEYPMLKYQEAILDQNFEEAESIFKEIKPENHLKIAKFLELNEQKELAYLITPEISHKLDLAIELGKLHESLEIASNTKKSTSWKQVGDLALMQGEFSIAEKCFLEAKDNSSLFLLYSATSNREGLAKLQSMSELSGEANLNFLSSYLLQDKAGCIKCLVNSKRIPEANFFSLAYAPSALSPLIEQWNKTVSDTTKNQYRTFKVLDPLVGSEAKKESALKVEELLDSVYTDTTIAPEHYSSFMASYSQDFEEKIKEDPNFKFTYDPVSKSEDSSN